MISVKFIGCGDAFGSGGRFHPRMNSGDNLPILFIPVFPGKKSIFWGGSFFCTEIALRDFHPISKLVSIP